MPKVGSIFNYCSHLENLSIAEIAEYSGSPTIDIPLENKFGNRVLYPQIVPVSAEDLNFDLAILKDIIEKDLQNFYKKSTRRIVISQGLINILPDLPRLVKVLLDSLSPLDLVTLVMQPENMGDKNLGTIIRPQITKNTGKVAMEVNGKLYQLDIGSLMVIPAIDNKVDIKFESNSALLLGRDRVITEVAGGALGLAIDLRKSAKNG